MTSPALVRLLLDTSYCLFLIRTRPRLVQVVFEHYRPGEIAVSSLSVAALEAAARRSHDPVRNRRALDQFLLPLTVVDFDAEAARCLGRIGGEAGFGGGQMAHSLLLAAQALRLNATLVTAQPALYAGIDGVTVRAGLGMEEQLAPLPAALPTAPADGRDEQRTIRLSGSHDLSLTLLGDWLHAEHPNLHFAAANVGSLLGLVALMQHTAHLAGSHLLDEETGDFNIGAVRKLLAPQGLHVVILGFVERIQGILVARGNPKQIGGLADLQRDDVSFVNRQGGAGTRILFDYQLRKLDGRRPDSRLRQPRRHPHGRRLGCGAGPRRLRAGHPGGGDRRGAGFRPAFRRTLRPGDPGRAFPFAAARTVGGGAAPSRPRLPPSVWRLWAATTQPPMGRVLAEM
jgi:predicted nucleic acid-binding protein